MHPLRALWSDERIIVEEDKGRVLGSGEVAQEGTTGYLVGGVVP